jgi:phosphatidylglycerophosphate synthase
VAAAADALGILRLGAAALLPTTLARGVDMPEGSWRPLCLMAFAAITDFIDGRLARRAGPTRHGAILDNAADVSVVLAATVSGASLGLVPWAAPLAIAVAVGAYALATIRLMARSHGAGLARSRFGHAAGVVNYALALLLAGAVAMPGAGWDGVLRVASLGVVAINLAAVVERFVPTTSVPVLPGGGSRDRSARSSP